MVNTQRSPSITESNDSERPDNGSIKFSTLQTMSINVESTIFETSTNQLSAAMIDQITCSPAVLEHRKQRIRIEIAKIQVKIIEVKDALEKSVQKQDFLIAQDLKTKINNMELDKDKLAHILENACPQELQNVIDER